MGALIEIGALNRIGALISKRHIPGGALIRKGALIARALNRIITVDGECRNKNCLKGRGGNDVQQKKEKKN